MKYSLSLSPYICGSAVSIQLTSIPTESIKSARTAYAPPYSLSLFTYTHAHARTHTDERVHKPYYTHYRSTFTHPNSVSYLLEFERTHATRVQIVRTHTPTHPSKEEPSSSRTWSRTRTHTHSREYTLYVANA